jgi:cytochrome bd ubiquinol oxidase subunit I
VSLLTLSRYQFAITVMFHMTFPAITVGTSILLCVLYGMHWKTGKAVYLQMFRFWRRIFAVGFAIGVVAGIVIVFQFGLDWGVFAASTGPIMGPILGMEVVTAFFVEAGFIGIVLYGDGRVRPRTMFAATVMVALGTVLSSTWIIANNSWMQTPSGFVIRHGQFEPVNWLHVIFSPSFIWRWPHLLNAVLISAGIFVAGIGAWYLVKGRALPFARRSVSIGLGMTAILLPLQLFLGDSVASHVLPHQYSKGQALEGNWTGTGADDNTSYIIFAIPDQQAERNIVQLSIPCLGSAFNDHDLTCHTGVPGLDLTPAQDRPLMTPVFWGFRTMFYGALLLFGTVFFATIQRFRRKLWTSRRFHKFLVWMTPVGILSILGGWVTAETGRQPWVVFGYLRTSAAVSHLAPAQLMFSMFAFVLMYATMLGAYIAYIAHTMRVGPERDHPDFEPGQEQPDRPPVPPPSPRTIPVPDTVASELATEEAGA